MCAFHIEGKGEIGYIPTNRIYIMRIEPEQTGNVIVFLWDKLFALLQKVIDK